MKTAYGCYVVDGESINVSSTSSQSGHTGFHTALAAAYKSKKPVVITNLCNGASGANPLTPAYATVYPSSTSYIALIGTLKITVTNAGAATVAIAS